jgi:oligoribonuclease NrnB/cAMP/cGMP phosphodiesterase (DHH superfamily)
MESWKPDLCIYHGSCDDGFGAAWVVHKAFGDDVEFFAGVYGKEPPNVAGKNVLMVDFSYKRPVIDDMIRSGDVNQAMTLLILDHHKTAASDLTGIEKPEGGYDPYVWRSKWEGAMQWPVRAVFDMERSGAQIAWDYFFDRKPRPLMIDLIGDRDLWRFQYGDTTKQFSAALRTYPMTFEVWDQIASNPDGLIEEGKGILRAHNANIEKFVADRYLDVIDNMTVPVVNVPYHYASDTAHALLQKCPEAPFAACWFRRGDGMIQYSLRSEDSRVDVSEVAKKFGGGGHRNAAGYQVAP